jgi:glycine dehydrogenase subunit 1
MQAVMRYLPLSATNRRDMLKRVGVSNINQLFADVPEEVLLTRPLDLPHHQGELAVERHLTRLAEQNIPASKVPFFVGAGAYKHAVPASVDHLIQRSEFLTSYTPYQPEIAQGTLQYLFEFQTQIARLTGMDVANASMYDGSTAAAEAVLMAHRITKRRKAIIAGHVHPHYTDVIRTYSDLGGDVCHVTPLHPQNAAQVLSNIEAALDKDVSCVVIQTPDFFGNLHDLKALADKIHAAGALLIVVVTEIISLGLITPPAEMGADIVVAEGQSIGVGLNFGGPYIGIFATKHAYVRQMPGRVCGETVDAEGKRGFVLTLSTREQHIRREKATSNICTNSGLCCLAFTIHMTLLGQTGLKHLAQLNHANAVLLADLLAEVKGVEILNPSFFNEFTVRLNKPAAQVVEALVAQGILAGVPASRLLPDQGVDNLLLIASTEINTDEDRAALMAALQKVL